MNLLTRTFLTCASLFLPVCTFAQLFAQERYKPSGPDTIFYPFYNSSQMIEIDYAAEWQREVNFQEMMHPRALPWSSLIPAPQPNIYLFRNDAGLIVKSYNTTKSLQQFSIEFRNVPLHKKINSSHAYYRYHNIKYSGAYPYNRSAADRSRLKGCYLVYESGQLPVKEIKSLAGQNVKLWNGPVGLIDSLGNVILPLVYNQISPVSNDLLVNRNNRFGIVNKKNEVIVPLQYDNCNTISEQKILFSLDQKFICMYDAGKKKIIRLDNYDYINFNFITGMENDNGFNEGSGLVPVRKNEKTGLLDKNFKQLLAPIYDYCGPFFQNGLARVNRNRKWGYIDKRGKEIIPCVYDDATDFDAGFSTVIRDGTVLCIDRNILKSKPCPLGSKKWKMTERENYAFIKDRKIISRDQLEGVLNDSGRIIIPLIYDHINGILNNIPDEEYLQNFYKVNRFDKLGIIDKNGNEILPCIYDYIGDFNGDVDLATLGYNNNYGLIDKSFNLLMPVVYESLNPWQITGKIVFSENKLFGWMELNRNIMVSPQYDEVNQVYDGRIRVKKGSLYGIVDVYGKVIIPVSYPLLSEKFSNGLIIANRLNKSGVLDTTGKEVIPFRYDALHNFEKKITGAAIKNKLGFIDRSGKELTDFMYDFIGYTWEMDGLIMVKKNNKIGFADETGKEVIPCIYDEENAFGPEKGHHLRLNDNWIWIKNPVMTR